MNLLFDIGHPAHVHLFKNFIFHLKGERHKVIVVSRKKDVTELLLDHYKINHFPVTAPAGTRAGMFKELLIRNNFIFRLQKEHHFDASFGTSASIGFLRLRYGVPAYNFNEDDDDVVKLYSYLAYPFATKIINPDCIKYKKWDNKRTLYPSYHELAYLHPDNFIPDVRKVRSYNLNPGQYVIIRLSALMAHHDSGMRGITTGLLKKIREVVQDYLVLESDELKGNSFNPYDIHHILAFARMIISDSQTMTIEGSVLGVPAVRINTFIGRSTVINELEQKYQLAYGFYPEQEEKILDTINYLASEKNIRTIWEKKREKMLKDKIDLNSWMIGFFRQEISA